jgi:hypothetical protein
LSLAVSYENPERKGKTFLLSVSHPQTTAIELCGVLGTKWDQTHEKQPIAAAKTLKAPTSYSK